MITLFGCGNNSEVEKIELTFRITWDEISGRGDAINVIVSSYNNSQDEVNVTMIGGNENNDEINPLLTSDNPTEIFVLPYRFVQYYGEMGYLNSLENDFQGELDSYYPSILNLAKIDDELYGMPWIGHSMALIYNKDILDEAEVDILSIDSFASLLLALDKVESNTDKFGIGLVGANHHDLSWMTTQIIYSFGGTLFEDDENKISINSDETNNALDFYINDLGKYAQDGWENHNGVDVMDAFRNQEIAFEIQGPWGITDIWKNGNQFNVGAISFNKIGGYSEVGILMLSIPSSIPESKLEAAKNFVKYMTSDIALELIMLGEYIPKYQEYYPFRVPIKNDINNSTFFTQFPSFKEFIYGFEDPSINSPIPEWTTLHNLFYQPLLHEVIIGEMTIDEFLIKIEIEGDNLLDD